jgi:hypothetical protein
VRAVLGDLVDGLDARAVNSVVGAQVKDNVGLPDLDARERSAVHEMDRGLQERLTRDLIMSKRLRRRLRICLIRGSSN